VSQPASVLKDWIERINTEGRGLTKFEESFMLSVTDKAERGIKLSDREAEIIERIYAERTPC